MSGMAVSSRGPDLQAVHAALATGRLVDAEAGAASIVREYPDCTQAWVLLAMLACESGRHVEARTLADRALVLEPRNAQAHYVRARALKGAGNLVAAERGYRDSLALDPDYPEALVSLAILMRSRGEPAAALPLLEHALRLQPLMIEAEFQLGAALLDLGHHAPAAAALERGLTGAPNRLQMWLQLGNVRAAVGDWTGSLHAFDRAAGLDDRLAACHDGRGAALAHLGRHAEAAAAFRTALRLDASARHSRVNLAAALIESGATEEALRELDTLLAADPRDAAAHANRGIALRALSRHSDAAEAFRLACDIEPDNAELWNLLGLAEQWLDHPEQAERCYRQALALTPDAIAPLVNWANLCDDQGRFEDAAAMLREAVAAKPDQPQLLSNLGVRLVALRRPAEALRCFEHALALDPSLDTAKLHAGIAHLLCGQYERGWALYESRWVALPELAATRPNADARQWAGEPIAGAAILVYAEQGLGDALQFVRYVPQLTARGARVHLLVPASLKALFADIDGVTAVHAFGEALPLVQWQVAMLSLPHLLQTTLATIPASVPYLRVDRDRRSAWQRRLGARDGCIRVGLVWAGDPRPHDRKATVVDRRRSIRFADYAPLWTVPGVQWYSVQKGGAAAQIRDGALGVEILDPTEALHDFTDTAAFLLHLDLLISVDTSVVHLAGALGVPVWLLSRFDGCWRWLLDRDDSPWYPTLRIFRQARPLQWRPLLEQVASALETFVAQSDAAQLEAIKA